MRKRILTIVIVMLVIVAAVLTYERLKYGRETLPSQYLSSMLRNDTSIHSFPAPGLAHIVIILEENKTEQSVIGSPDAHYINMLADNNARASNYYAVTNPSLPNYLALTSGSSAGFKYDCSPPGGNCQAKVTNIADRLEMAGKTWKEYAESMPSPCYANNSGDYAVRHNPFLYYPDITSNLSRCKTHVVPLTNLMHDLERAADLPDYSFITPNLCSDMHNCPVLTGDDWLSQHVPQILHAPAFAQQNSLLVIVWDEGSIANNNVPVIFAGPAAKKGYVSVTYYSHYSLLHTIEAAWNMQPLTANDARAPLMYDMLSGHS